MFRVQIFTLYYKSFSTKLEVPTFFYSAVEYHLTLDIYECVCLCVCVFMCVCYMVVDIANGRLSRNPRLVLTKTEQKRVDY